MYCCMAQDSCTAYSRTYDQSKAAEIVRGTDYNEGRAFFTPGTVDKCQGAGTGQHGAKFSNCHAGQLPARASTGTAADKAAADLANDIVYMNKRAFWGTGTKNQNMGMLVRFPPRVHYAFCVFICCALAGVASARV